jgi:hypothetical protein
MTKYNGRTRAMATKQIDESLRRLQVETQADVRAAAAVDCFKDQGSRHDREV